jgi:carotenoid cleavage dioxygenase-like enzyme
MDVFLFENSPFCTPFWFFSSSERLIHHQAVIFLCLKLLQALLGAPEEYGLLTWQPEYGTPIRILALDGSGEVRSFKLPAMFHYHWANIFEAQHRVLGPCMCLDVFTADDPRSLNMFDLDKCSDSSLDNFDSLLKFDLTFTVLSCILLS